MAIAGAARPSQPEFRYDAPPVESTQWEAYACPVCGAVLRDTDLRDCPYCRSALFEQSAARLTRIWHTDDGGATWTVRERKCAQCGATASRPAPHSRHIRADATRSYRTQKGHGAGARSGALPGQSLVARSTVGAAGRGRPAPTSARRMPTMRWQGVFCDSRPIPLMAGALLELQGTSRDADRCPSDCSAAPGLMCRMAGVTGLLRSPAPGMRMAAYVGMHIMWHGQAYDAKPRP